MKTTIEIDVSRGIIVNLKSEIGCILKKFKANTIILEISTQKCMFDDVINVKLLAKDINSDYEFIKSMIVPFDNGECTLRHENTLSVST